MEFNIPRMGRRIDVILVIGSMFALEFKVGETTYDRAAIEQVWDYALDLKNFHEASHNVAIAPILVATESQAESPPSSKADAGQRISSYPDNADKLDRTQWTWV